MPDKRENVPEVPKEMIILRFMAENEMPVKPKEIYGGLIHQRDISFSYRTVQGKLKDLLTEGLVQRVQIDDTEGVVKSIGDSDDKRAYYLITDEGRERVAEEFDL